MDINNLCLQSINEIRGRKYIIKEYQRRYRWKTEQVEKLLNDLSEFQEESSDEKTFYCLQPVVMHRVKKKNKTDLLSELQRIEEENFSDRAIYHLQNSAEWEIVDGQQRLTTISLILNSLGIEGFDIKTSTRSMQQEWGSRLDDVFKEKNKDTINKWIDKRLLNADDKIQFAQLILNRVKVIWYEINEAPDVVYKRLNTGKIPLTDSELIKAVLLCSRKTSDLDKDEIGLLQSEIAMGWHNIEYKLQDDGLFYFLFPWKENSESRMDALCRIIFDYKLLDEEDTVGSVQYSTYPVFNYIFDKISEGGINASMKKLKDYLWDNVIMELFNTFLEWYGDVELYHYIGYLIETKNKIGKIYENWVKKKSKSDFLSEIKKEIYDSLKNMVNDDQIDKSKCRNILLFHNIQTSIQMNKSGAGETNPKKFSYRFPFDIFKKEKWDVEHIEPETECDFSRISDQEWYRKCFSSFPCVNSDVPEETGAEDDSTLPFKEFLQKHPYEIELKEEKDKNSLKNYVLLDSGTNRSYKNAIFPVKRLIIANKDKGLTESNEKTTPFIPPCTKNVFMKYYSGLYLKPTVWTKEDAGNYLEDIKQMVGQIRPEKEE